MTSFWQPFRKGELPGGTPPMGYTVLYRQDLPGAREKVLLRRLPYINQVGYCVPRISGMDFETYLVLPVWAASLLNIECEDPKALRYPRAWARLLTNKTLQAASETIARVGADEYMDFMRGLAAR